MAVTSGSFLTNSVSYTYNGVNITTRFRLDWSVTSTDLVNNQYTINVKLTQVLSPDGYQRSVQRYSITVDGTTTSNSYGTETYGGNGTVWANYNQVITMNDDGNKNVTFKVEVAVGQYSFNCTATQSFQMGTIPRYSTLTIPTMTMGSQATITVNQAVSTFYSVVGITYNGAYTEFQPQTGSSFTITWTPTDITSSVTDSDHADAVIQCFTYFDSALSQGGLITEETAPVYVPANIVPSVTIQSITEANSNLVGLPFIVGYSLLRVVISFTGNTGSTYVSGKLVCGNETITSSAQTFITRIPLASTSNVVTVTVTDSRGRTASATQTVSAVNYSPPTLALDLTRTDSNNDPSPLGTNVSIKATWNYANIQGNSATIVTTINGSDQSYTPSVNSQTTWTQVATFTGVSVADELTVTSVITDKVSSSTVTITLPKATIPISMYEDGADVGVTFGRTSSEPDAHFFMPIHLYDSETIVEHESSDITHTATDILFWDDASVVTPNVVTKTSGAATLVSSEARRFGKLVTLHILLHGTTTTINRGNDIFQGTIQADFRPPYTMVAPTYISSRNILCAINSSGSVTARYMGYAQGNTDGDMNFTFTFVQ